jgi:hypothetical protein
MIHSANYINELIFDYVETYSFQRGKEFEESLKLRSSSEITQYLIYDKGKFHPHSKKTNTFKHDTPMADRIKQILRIEVVETLPLLCAPEYRDAFVFYDHNNQIVSTLNICLSCMHLKSEGVQLKADIRTYDLLKKLFLEIGHEVEKPEHSWIEEMEQLKKKIRKR